LENMRSAMKFVAWMVILALVLQFAQAAPWLIFLLGGALALGLYLTKAARAAKEADTLKRVGQTPLGNILDANLALTAKSARQLLGDDSFDFEVVGESFYSQNFSALQRNWGLEDGQDWDDEATLIADPGNGHSNTAVAVFVSGLKVGYVPETTSASVYRFLLQNGGYARADAAIYFSAADGKNSVWLDVAKPMNFRTE
jgi:hypothetical protein